MTILRTGARVARSNLTLTDEAYLNSLLNGLNEWEEDLREIRLFYDGRQIDEFGRLGDQIAKRFREMFAKYPACNLVKTGISTIADRLAITAVTSTTNPAAAKVAQEWWDITEMTSWQLDLYRYLLRDSMSIIIASWDAKTNTPSWTVHELYDGEAGNCRVHFDSDGNLMFVSKRWVEHDQNDRPTGRVRVTAYYTDRIERYVAENGSQMRLMSVDECQAEDPGITSNPELWLMPDGITPIGSPAVVFYNNPFDTEASDLMTPQVGLNESILSWHVGGRYSGFRMLVMENATEQVDKAGNPVPLRVGPGRFLRVRSQGTQPTRVYPIPAEDVGAIFNGAVLPYIDMAAMAKRWPIHIFNVTAMPSSGELVRMLEGPLVAQCDIKKPMLADSWRELFQVTARMAVVFGRQAMQTENLGLDFSWKPSETKNEQVDLDVIGKKKNVGNLPDEEVWRLMGYTADEIKALQGYRLAAQKQALSLALAESIPTTTQ